MSKSSRLTPNQFGLGLTVDATRLEHDLVALANRYNSPPPTDIARRWVETHMVAGFIPNSAPKDFFGVSPQQPPWMGVYNSELTATQQGDTAPVTLPPAKADIINPWRAKGTAQVGLAPTLNKEGSDGDDSSTMLSWEMSWSQTGPCLLDSLRLVLATDAFYANNFLFDDGASTIGKTPGNPVDSIVLQVLVDSALSQENRQSSLAPVLVNQFPATQYLMALPANSDVLNTMAPPPCLTNEMEDYIVPNGLCIDVFPRQPLPENSRVRLILSIPKYQSGPLPFAPISQFGPSPWQTFVLTGHVTLLQPLESQ